jgi:vacuolar-type H+-ATPase subunit E/Vma4
MSLEELIVSLVNEAESEKGKILGQAEREAAGIMVQAEEEAARIRLGPKEEAARRVANERARRSHAARVEASGLISQARYQALELAARRAAEMAEAFTATPAWPAHLEELIREAADGLSSGALVLRPQDAAAAREIAGRLGGSFKVRTEAGMPAGVKILDDDGLVEVDNTFPIRLSRYLAFNESEVAALLFDQADRA